MKLKEKKILEQFAEAKQKVKAYKETIDELLPLVKEIVLEYTKGESGDYVLLDNKKFTITKRRKIVYPHYVIEAQEKVKELKTLAEQKGEVDYSEDTNILFKEV